MNKIPPESSKVVVIGGGVAGCSVAYHLTEFGWKDVILLERDQLTSGTTWHAAGLIGQLGSSATITRLRNYSLNLYKNLENNKSQFSSKILDIIYKKCPMSLYVSTKLINDAKGKSLKECLEIEYQLSQKLVYRTDFDNGVNSVLVTKDHNPQWSPAKIDQINTEELNKYFETHTEKLYL